MRLRLIATFIALSLLTTAPLHAQSFSADDFLPPAQADDPAKTAELLAVQNPGEVSTETGAVSGEPAIKAATLQDAINAFIDQRKAGHRELMFPGGFGFAAIGAATYDVYENNTATRIAQRNAYTVAYMNAKTYLSEALYGLSNDGVTKIADSVSNIETGSGGNLTDMRESTTEKLAQTVNAMLRGYVVYDVHDDFDKKTVYVTIVATPKTMGYYERPDPSTIVADSVHDGLNQALVEIKKDLVPPVGSRTIFVPATGEIAYVGFGSAVVHYDSDPAVQARQNLNAEKIAKARASDSLCGVIVGDQVTATSSRDSQTSTMISDFEKISANDPIAQIDSPNYRALNERRKEFLSVESNSSMVTSMRKGTLPPGVSTQGWRDADNTFAYAISVYLPSATARARGMADMMRDSQILDAPSGNSSGAPKAPAAPPATPEVKQGPSGRIEADGAI